MRKALILILSLSAVIEVALTVGGFAAPDLMLSKFQVETTDGTRFLAFVVTWCLALVSLVCLLALKWVRQGDPRGWDLSLVLGVWWFGIGLGLSIAYGRWDHLVLDSLKGAVIVGLALGSPVPRHPDSN